MQALNIYIALLERRRLLASAQRQNSLGSQQGQSPQAPSMAADADLDKVIAAIVPHVPTLAAVLCASSPSALLVRVHPTPLPIVRRQYIRNPTV